MADKAFEKRKEQESILTELESIKDLLDDDELIHDDMEIPLLQEVIEDVPASSTPSEIDAQSPNQILQRPSSAAENNRQDQDTNTEISYEIPSGVKIEPIEIPESNSFDEEEGSLSASAEGSLSASAEGSLSTEAEGSLSASAEGSLSTEAEGSLPPSAEGSLSKDAEGSLSPDDNELTSEDESSADDTDNSKTPTPQSENSPVGVLPGQQSLFEDNKSKDEPGKAEEIKTSTHADKPSNTAEIEIQNIENPFLPKHIRERLNGMADVPAFEKQNFQLRKDYQSNHQLAQQVKDSADKIIQTSKASEPLHAEADAMVDSLIKEFMPIIEAKLRLVLKEKASDITSSNASLKKRN